MCESGLPSRTGGHGRYPKHPCRVHQPPCGSMYCILRTCPHLISFVLKDFVVHVSLDGQVLLLQPLAVVQGRQGLLRGGNEVLVRGLVITLSDLVQFLVELLKLCGLRHQILEHKLRGLVGLVAPVEEELKAVVDQSQIEEKTVSGQAITTVTDNLDTALRIVTVQASQDFVVGETTGSFHGNILGGPCSDDLIVILYPGTLQVSMMELVVLVGIAYLVVAHGDRLVDVIANRSNFAVTLQFLLGSEVFSLLFTLLNIGLLVHQITRVFLGLFPWCEYVLEMTRGWLSTFFFFPISF